MKQERASLRDVQSLQSSLARQQRQAAADAQEDVVIDGERRLLLRSPNGTYFGLTVDNAGALSTVNLGTSL